jgi:uncharacterized membrane protein YhaH (DUF805 family)
MNEKYLSVKPFGWFRLALAAGMTGKGRAGRREYWWIQLFLMAFTNGVGYLCFFLSLALGLVTDFGSADVSMALLGLVLALFVVAFVNTIVVSIPVMGLTVRRLHDRNLTGWLALLIPLPLLNFVLIVLLAMDGTHGPNPYGPDPRDGDPREALESGLWPARPNLCAVFSFFAPVYGIFLYDAIRRYQPMAAQRVLMATLVGLALTLVAIMATAAWYEWAMSGGTWGLIGIE